MSPAGAGRAARAVDERAPLSALAASRQPHAIALDGPAAAGKSTVGRRVAEALDYLYFDSGALYRALTVLALDEGVGPENGPELAALASRRPIDVAAQPRSATGYAVLAGGEDVTAHLHTAEVDAAVSAVSRHSEVRRALLDQQRRVARQQAAVMVGRDIGTVILPDAELKVYLDASVEARARRRFRERLAHGGAPVFAEILAAMEARDALDAGRSEAPLAVAPDAVVVNTDACTVDQVVAHVLALVDRWPDALTTGGGQLPCRPPAPAET